MTTKQVRHGDVLLTRVGDAAVTEGRPRRRRATLAYGEATGHAHVAVGIDLAYQEGHLYLPMGGEIDHEEHGLIVLEPGEYVVRHQQEWVLQDHPTAVRD